MDETRHNSNEKCEFLLFISGMSRNSAMALENITRIIRDHTPDSTIEIIDIRDRNDMAVDHQIIGIPTLIRTTPKPRKMIIGDLSDEQKVLKILDIVS